MDALIRDLIGTRPQAALALIAQHCSHRAGADLTVVATSVSTDRLCAEIALGGAQHRAAAVDIAGHPVALGATVAGKVYTTATAALAATDDGLPLGLHLAGSPFHPGSAMVIPLAVAGQTEALLILVRAEPGRGYTAADLETLAALASDGYAVATAVRERIHEARVEERDRIAARLRRDLVDSLFSGALTLHQVAFRTARQADLDRLLGVIETIDGVVKQLRSSAFTTGPLDVTAVRDTQSGTITATVSGRLSRETSTTARAALLKLAAEGPTALLLDLSPLDESSADRLSALAAVTRAAHENYDVPVIMFGAAPGVARALSNFRLFAVLCHDYDAALAAARTATPQWVRRRLAAGAPAVAEARELVGNCCLEWELRELLKDAREVMTELVEGAVRRAGSDLDVTVSATRRYLRLAVRDRSLPADAEVEAPGLGIVAAPVANWSSTQLPDVRIVWAMLKIAA